MSKALLLIDAKNRILDPAKWTQEEYARDEEGLPTDSCNGDAVCWCSIGTCERSLNNSLEPYSVDDLKDYLERAIETLTKGGESWVSTYNDGHTHAEVLQVFDLAIQIAEQEED